jgi:hypothetical protein
VALAAAFAGVATALLVAVLAAFAGARPEHREPYLKRVARKYSISPLNLG